MMDIDLEFDSSDPITEFLCAKLSQIQAENAQLSSSLKKRQEIATNLRQEISNRSKNDTVRVVEIWKKVFNGKYIVGLEMRNESDSNANNIKVILNWTPASPVTYKTYLFANNGLTPVSQLRSSGQLIIVFDIPLFTETLVYVLSGFITFQQNEKNYILNFPSSIGLEPKDITKDTNVVHLHKVLEGSLKDLLALALSGEKKELVMIFDANQVESVLENDCSLSQVNIVFGGKFYLAFKISPELDGILTEVKIEDNIVYFNTYGRDLEKTVAFLHYIHRLMVGVVIIPKSLYQPDLSLSDLTLLLRKSLSEELDQLEQGSKGDLKELRNKLADLEHNSDVLVARIKQKM